MTQLEYARQGIVTDKMIEAAAAEGVTATAPRGSIERPAARSARAKCAVLDTSKSGA